MDTVRVCRVLSRVPRTSMRYSPETNGVPAHFAASSVFSRARQGFCPGADDAGGVLLPRRDGHLHGLSGRGRKFVNVLVIPDNRARSKRIGAVRLVTRRCVLSSKCRGGCTPLARAGPSRAVWPRLVPVLQRCIGRFGVKGLDAGACRGGKLDGCYFAGKKKSAMMQAVSGPGGLRRTFFFNFKVNNFSMLILFSRCSLLSLGVF